MGYKERYVIFFVYVESSLRMKNIGIKDKENSVLGVGK